MIIYFKTREKARSFATNSKKKSPSRKDVRGWPVAVK